MDLMRILLTTNPLLIMNTAWVQTNGYEDSHDNLFNHLANHQDPKNHHEEKFHANHVHHMYLKSLLDRLRNQSLIHDHQETDHSTPRVEDVRSRNEILVLLHHHQETKANKDTDLAKLFVQVAGGDFPTNDHLSAKLHEKKGPPLRTTLWAANATSEHEDHMEKRAS